MKKLRILYIISGLRIGGAEKLLLLTLKHIDKAKFSPVLVSLYRDDALFAAFVKTGFPILCLNYKRKFNPFVVMSLVKIIHQYKPSIIHTHLPHATIWGRIAAFLSGVKCVYTTEHNMSIWQRKFGAFYILYKMTHRINTRIIAVSNAIKNTMIREFRIPAEKITVIHNGIEIKTYTTEMNNPTDLNRYSHPILGTIGRLHRSKGHEYLIQAFKAVYHHYPKAHLIIVGEGDQKGELCELISRLNLNENIHLIGSRNDIPNILHLFDIYIFPSLNEGLGISLIEACAAGKPCIATETGGIPEIIKKGETGFLVPPRDEVALANTILFLLENRELTKQIVENAMHDMQGRYQIEDKVRTLEKIYLSC